MKRLSYWAIALTIAGVDQKIKNEIEKKSPTEASEFSLGRSVVIHRCHNKGMMLNIGESYRPIVAILSLVMTVVLAVVFLFTLGKKGSNLLKLGQALMLGGAFSNTYDRLKRKYVVDYISFNLPFKGLRNIVFNIADFAIMIGATLVAISSHQKSREEGDINQP
ncbi:MAG: signal peptidase II [Lachnospiraceae bacterium]|nr:signal peptidase II [Lachnospiraceae bacterium]